MNQVAIFAPNNLTEDELTKVFDFVYDFIDETKINLVLYRTIDIEMIRFFLELPDSYAQHLKVHVPDRLETLENAAVEKGIRFLMENGTEVREHFFGTEILTREKYEEIVKEVVMESNEVLSFYKEDPKQISKLLMPFNHSKKYKKNGYIKHLTGEKEVEFVPYV